MKTCNYKGCKRPQWSNKTGLCQIHTPKKRLKGKSILRKSAIKKRKRIDTTDTSFGFTSQKEMFEDIWIQTSGTKGDMYSTISGIKLTELYGTDMWYSCFAHILDKGKYPRYKLNPENIMLVTPYEHFLIDQGTNKLRKEYEKKKHCSFDIFYKKREELLSLYNNH